MVPEAKSERFTVAVQAVDGAVVLALAGELDHDTAQPLGMRWTGHSPRGVGCWSIWQGSDSVIPRG